MKKLVLASAIAAGLALFPTAALAAQPTTTPTTPTSTTTPTPTSTTTPTPTSTTTPTPTSTTTPSAPPATTSTGTATPTTPPDAGQTAIRLSKGKGAPGTKVTIFPDCQGGHYVSSPAMDITYAGFGYLGPGFTYVGVVKDVAPGAYVVALRCHSYDTDSDTFASAKFTVVPKQTTKVPSGAPQTGGTDGPGAVTG
jgi:hypothetical protein